MHTYETLFITPPTLTETEERETVDTLLQVVTDGGGSLVANERMGRRRLAYPILKHNDGVYVRFLYDSEPDVPKELERRVRISDRVLRALTVRLQPNWAADAKKQAVIDAKARAEAAEREKEQAAREAEEAEEAEARKLAEAAGETTEAAPTAEGEASPATPTDASPAESGEAAAAPAATAESEPSTENEVNP